MNVMKHNHITHNQVKVQSLFIRNEFTRDFNSQLRVRELQYYAGQGVFIFKIWIQDFCNLKIYCQSILPIRAHFNLDFTVSS